MGEYEQRVLAAMQGAIGCPEEMVLLHRPYFPPSTWEYVKECLDTGWVSSAGAYVTKFEELLAQRTGAKRAVAVVNGTAALQICLHLSGVQRDDEILCPSLTFVATPNSISHCGAIPHFVDACPERLALSPSALASRLEQIAVPSHSGWINRETGRRLGAVVLMHCFGHPGDIDAIVQICDEYRLPLVEDAAESLGSYYKGKHTGRFSRVAAVSFNGNKILTTGGGGAILTDDDELADRAKHLTTTAKQPHAFEFYHDSVAWNFRMPNINAALGYAQLEILPQLLEAKRKLLEKYRVAFEGLEGITVLTEPSDSRSNYWLNALLLAPERENLRDSILQELNRASYQARPLWQPMHHLPMYAGCPRGHLDVTDQLYRSVINIPSSADLTLDVGTL